MRVSSLTTWSAPPVRFSGYNTTVYPMMGNADRCSQGRDPVTVDGRSPGASCGELRQWFCRKHKVRSGGYVRFPDQRLWKYHGLTRLGLATKYLPWAKA